MITVTSWFDVKAMLLEIFLVRVTNSDMKIVSIFKILLVTERVCGEDRIIDIDRAARFLTNESVCVDVKRICFETLFINVTSSVDENVISFEIFLINEITSADENRICFEILLTRVTSSADEVKIVTGLALLFVKVKVFGEENKRVNNLDLITVTSSLNENNIVLEIALVKLIPSAIGI